MKENQQPILLVRISKKEYNKTLLEDFKVHMNPQIGFRDEKGLTSGQFDPNEGLIYSKPFELRYSTDSINWKTLVLPENSISIKRNSNAYIFCMYSVQYEPSNYDPISKTYTQIIPWRYIKDFSIGGETDEIEMLIFLDSVAFKNILCEAADKAGFSYSSGLISYDLEEKQTDFNYVHDVMNDTFTSVFHKEEKNYGIQNEYRFSIICPEKKDFIRLPVENLERAKIYKMDIVKNQDIKLTFLNVELQENGHFKTFSGMKIDFMEV